MTSATTPALKNPPRRAGRRVQRSLGGDGICSRSFRMRSRRSDDLSPSAPHALQILAQVCAHGAAPDIVRVGEFLLRDTAVVVCVDYGPLPTCQETAHL